MATNQRKKKKQLFPMVQAHQISVPNQQPEPYYNPNEKQQLQSHRDAYKNASNVKPIKHDSPHKYANPNRPLPQKPLKNPDPDSSSEEDSSSSEETMISKPQKKVPQQKTSPNYHAEDGEHKEQKENKGLLDKMKSAVGMKEEKKLKNTKVVIELPRDILTAFFLLRLPRDKSRGVDPSQFPPGKKELPPYWDEYALYGKICLWLTVIGPYMIQWFVLCVLLENLVSDWEEATKAVAGNTDFWYNTVAFSVLFLYMWKDLASFYYSVYRYITYLQKKKGGISEHLKEAVVATGDAAAAAVEKTKSHVPDDTADISGAAKEAVGEVAVAVKFIEFRLWLLSVVFLYIGLTCYTLVKIPLEPDLVSKLEVSLSIFFILEVDDWAYELFIAQANILDDEEFDVVITEKIDRKAVIKRRQKKLAMTLSVVIGSTMFFWLCAWGIGWLY